MLLPSCVPIQRCILLLLLLNGLGLGRAEPRSFVVEGLGPGVKLGCRLPSLSQIWRLRLRSSVILGFFLVGDGENVGKGSVIAGTRLVLDVSQLDRGDSLAVEESPRA